ncbi:MAG: hypothetical protein A2156_06235 [Deltaproteobacteria bacterium RBG_16_48_10]|nr:MAG: hypothetical protein A2156_06235 [Deltaproteobacteria bacterium RBG_16_48_10]
MNLDISEIFCLFFVIAALQPLLRKKFLGAMRQRLIASFEKTRGSRVIVLIHRQETMSLLGFPIFRYIDVDDSYEEATNLGLHVTKGIPPELYQLVSLYPQPVRHQPSVEYLPVPRLKGPVHKL